MAKDGNDWQQGGCSMPEMKDGCVTPARGPIMAASEPESQNGGTEKSKEVSKMLATVGKEAPDFEANAFIPGQGFENIRLSNYKGQWIVLCFYPGDFTFV
jgi:peroxiredoxin (alkyl hydroperoxide reductase subunit C)